MGSYIVECIFLVSFYAIEAASRIISVLIVMDPLPLLKPSSLKAVLG